MLGAWVETGGICSERHVQGDGDELQGDSGTGEEEGANRVSVVHGLPWTDHPARPTGGDHAQRGTLQRRRPTRQLCRHRHLASYQDDEHQTEKNLVGRKNLRWPEELGR